MKFSIITICFNPGAVLQSAVASVLSQSYQDLEYIIVDGGSTDGTVETLDQLSDPRLQIISEPDEGLYDALNKGIRSAKGDVLGFVHADDFLAHSGVLQDIADRMNKAEIEAVYGDLQYVVEKTGRRDCETSPAQDFASSRLQDCETSPRQNFTIIRHWVSGAYDRKKLKWGWMPPHPSLYLSKDIYERAKLENGEYFDTSFSCAADYDFMMRVLSALEIQPVYLPEVLVKMRVGGVSNRSVKHMIRKSMEDWRVIRRNRIGHMHTLIWKNLSKLPQFFRR